MGTLQEKLTYLNQTKQLIKNAISAKGVVISDEDTMRSYASKIESINGGSDNNNIITDNCVLWLDGIDNKGVYSLDGSRNTNASNWYSKVGANFAVPNVTSDWTWEDDCVTFDGTTSGLCGFTINDLNTLLSGKINEITVEAVFKGTRVPMSSSYNDQIFSAFDINYVRFNSRSSYLFSCGATNNKTSRNRKIYTCLRLKNKTRCDVNKSLYGCYNSYDKVVKSADACCPTFNISNYPFYIGWNGSSSSDSYLLKGSIYSIRVYTRCLTNEEMLHNYEIDKARFNITD